MSAFDEIYKKKHDDRSYLEKVIVWFCEYDQNELHFTKVSIEAEKAAEQLATLETNCTNAIQANAELARLNADLQEKLDEYTEVFNRVIAEQCAPDERHCTCVPSLRMEINTLREIIKRGEE